MDLFYPEGMNVAGELEVHPALLGKSFMVLVDKQAVENWLLHVVMDRGVSCSLARILVSGPARRAVGHWDRLVSGDRLESGVRLVSGDRQSANQVVQIARQKSGGS